MFCILALKMGSRYCATVLVLFLLTNACFAQSDLVKDEVLNLAKQDPAAEKVAGPAAKIGDLKWIAGDWHGSAMGGDFEETWNPPFAGTMMGMFKFAKGDEVSFYELLTIVENDDSLLLRLKHFDKDLNGWEEKDKSIEFPLSKISATEAAFDGLVFRKIDDSTMHIVVTIEQKSESNDVKFVCKRRAKSAPTDSPKSSTTKSK